jgi:glutamate-1-semialdehyde 2,1-aminomutase
LSARVARFGTALSEVLGPDVQVPVAGPLIGVFFSPAAVSDYEGAAKSAATGRYPGLMHGLLERGVAIAPGAYEVFFPSLSHGEPELDGTVEAFSEVVRGGR